MWSWLGRSQTEDNNNLPSLPSEGGASSSSSESDDGGDSETLVQEEEGRSSIRRKSKSKNKKSFTSFPEEEKEKDSPKKKSHKKRKGKEKGLKKKYRGKGKPSSIRESFIDVGRNRIDFSKKATHEDKEQERERKIVDNKFFKVKETDVFDPETGLTVDTNTVIVVKDVSLTQTLSSFDLLMTGVEKQTGWFSGNRRLPIFSAESLAMRVAALREMSLSYNTPQYKALLEWLEEYYHQLVAKIEEQLEEGKISFFGLWYLFEKGNRFSATVGRGQTVGSHVLHMRYSNTMMGYVFQLQGEFVKSDGLSFFTEKQSFSIGFFPQLKEVLSLSIQPMTQEVLDVLSERGSLFAKIALNHSFMNYTRFMAYRSSPLRVNYFKADGRVMVDIATFNRMNPEYYEFGNNNNMAHAQNLRQNHQLDRQQQMLNSVLYNNAQGEVQTAAQEMTQQLANNGGVTSNSQSMRLTPDMYYMTWPMVAGFSFAAKRWGEIIIDNLSDIRFDDTAYENLVLPAEKKSLIKALVEDNRGEQDERATDLISGKGGGVIFLLHGPPGVGKTLTAEAIAELLHRPLYSVSVGELGTTAESLEQKLQEVLELASIWNAVVLIDEADIFLEKRTAHDILRNAMVGIFLRKLEYHQGVLFLTTNRVKCFDPAFNSRISVAIKYPDLEEEARAEVWKNLLSNNTTNSDLAKGSQELAKYPMNGRQIRSTIRLAMALARSQNTEINDQHVALTVKMAKEFDQDLLAEEQAGDY
ncbi:Mitochondrial sorting-like protein [Balamuthia mandrillaris]